ncbi:helix-turn-helix domain-containing protein [Streptomyces profundus]|uniref:helix-turn-helix domain-containing protein n=1 Tax=Streptomyces profundus TaxID=2867410 RepID=UPI001D16974C|nr:helix-turn-helix transcriptional regulator [Streptomyces sp. MA3_2.13]UED86322.1 helix-turn-helix domain-containing protein [Streptomyces sp. MA3_2.13]
MTDRPFESAEESGPTARRRQLGIRLLALREAAGLTAEAAGEQAGVSKATVSRYERAKGNVRWNQVDQLCRVYGVSDTERAELVELAKNSRVTEGWWVPYASRLPSPMRLLLAMENEATRISQYTTGVVPGLLQTVEYARAIKETPGSAVPPDDVPEYLSLRMQRQRVLDGPAAPTFHVVLDEAVLRRSVGGAEVMAAQLEHLLKRAEERHISIQVLPFSAGAHSAALSSFIVYGGADPTLDIIFIETAVGSLFLEEPGAREHYGSAIDFLRREALDSVSSAELIAEVRNTHLSEKQRGK